MTKNKIIKILALIIIISLVISTITFYKIIENKISNINLLEDQIKTLKTEKEATQKILQNSGINCTVKSEIIDWAYKNAKPYIPKTYVKKYLQEAKKYNNYLMIVSIIAEESHFDPFAKSNAGAKGLGQIRTKSSKDGQSIWLEELINAGIWQEEVDVYDYKKNIAAVNFILNKYKEQYGNWRKVLFQYVNGSNDYVSNVLSNYAKLTLMLQEEGDSNSEE